MIVFILGRILLTEAALMVLPLLVAVLYGESILPFLLPALALAVCGALMSARKPKSMALFARDGLAVVAMAWITMSAFGALPFCISGDIPHFVDAFFETVSGFTTSPVVVLLILNVIFLIIGCFMDANAAILILTPAIWPLITAVGIDPTHLGLVMVLNLMIGLLTPPVGMCLFTVSRVANLPLEQMIKSVLPFYIPLLACLLLVTLCPSLVLFVPGLLA